MCDTKYKIIPDKKFGEGAQRRKNFNYNMVKKILI